LAARASPLLTPLLACSRGVRAAGSLHPEAEREQAPEGPPVVTGPRAMLVEPGPGDAGIEAREFPERAGRHDLAEQRLQRRRKPVPNRHLEATLGGPQDVRPHQVPDAPPPA